MRISDWSSDVCSSDLVDRGREHIGLQHHPGAAARRRVVDGAMLVGREVANLHRRARPCPALERAAGHAVPQRAGEHVGVKGQGDGGEGHDGTLRDMMCQIPPTKRANRLIGTAMMAARRSSRPWSSTWGAHVHARSGGATRQTANAMSRIRSEEHTSELQSLMRISYAVFCLTKKTNQQLTLHR